MRFAVFGRRLDVEPRPAGARSGDPHRPRALTGGSTEQPTIGHPLIVQCDCFEDRRTAITACTEREGCDAFAACVAEQVP